MTWFISGNTYQTTATDRYRLLFEMIDDRITRVYQASDADNSIKPHFMKTLPVDCFYFPTYPPHLPDFEPDGYGITYSNETIIQTAITDFMLTLEGHGIRSELVSHTVKPGVLLPAAIRIFLPDANVDIRFDVELPPEK
jgi:hypothetical protein